MSGREEISYQLDGVGHFINDYFINVPHYQRSYAWEEKNVIELIDDINTALSTNDNYFIGSIVLIKKEGEDDILEVVDGQQRLATVLIILAEIRNWFFNNDQRNQSRHIEGRYLRRFIPRTNEIESRLSLGTNDKIFFDEFIVKREDERTSGIESKKESHKRIIEAKKLAEDHVSRLVRLNRNSNILHDWQEFLESKLKIIRVIVPNHSDAYTIFETLNDRGIVLAQTDLIKNYIFKKTRERDIESVQNNWAKMTGIIESADSEKMILTYVKHFWSSNHGLTREADLYSSIRDNVTNSTQASSYSVKLESSAEDYAAILNPEHRKWSRYDDVAKDYLKTLIHLKLKQFRPLILAAMTKINHREVTKILKIVVSWSVRNLITGSTGGGPLEKEFSEKAKSINNEEITNANELKSSLGSIIPNDTEFKDKFISATVSKSYLARYYLGAIENQKRGDNDPGLIVNLNKEIVTLEHILPQNPNNLARDWPNFSPEVKDACYKRIGNLTLLKAPLNSELGNGPYDSKKIEYTNEEFEITKSIARDYDAWNYEAIENRQIELAELAVSTWNLDI